MKIPDQKLDIFFQPISPDVVESNGHLGRAKIWVSSSGNYFEPLEYRHQERAAQFALLHRWLGTHEKDPQ